MAAGDASSRRAKEPSFVQTVRRGQLVDCAIDVIAQLGYEKASTVRIAQRAGVSRGVLTYHFRDRADLIEQVVQTVYELGVRELGPVVAAAKTPRDALLAFIGGSVDFYSSYPRHMAALSEIFAAQARSQTAAHTQEMDDLRQILLEGQRAGQFRAFDADIMASTVRAALDAAVSHIQRGNPPEPLRGELLRTFDAATRKEDA